MNARVLKRVLVVASVCAVSFWALYLYDYSIVQAYRNGGVERAAPVYLLNGALIELGEQSGTRQVANWGDAASEPVRRLLLVSDDRCVYSQAILEKWKLMLASLSRDVRIPVDVVSFSGMRIPDDVSMTLKAHGTPHSVHVVTQAERFRMTTGLGATPRTIVLDEAARATVIARVLDDEHESLVKTCLLGSVC